MKVRIILDVDDNVRRALRARVGQTGMAQRHEIEQHARGILRATFADYTYELETGENPERKGYE